MNFHQNSVVLTGLGYDMETGGTYADFSWM